MFSIVALVVVYVVASLHWPVSHLWAVAYAMLSIVTFFAYAFDKTGAIEHRDAQVREVRRCTGRQEEPAP